MNCSYTKKNSPLAIEKAGPKILKFSFTKLVLLPPAGRVSERRSGGEQQDEMDERQQAVGAL